MEFSASELIFMATWFIAAFVNGITGLGGAMVAVPVIAYLMPAHTLIPVSGFADVLDYVPQLRAMLDAMSRQFKDFGCCGHYLECSDAKACVHSDPRFALSCCYFYNLRDGKIFYGKNRNI